MTLKLKRSVSGRRLLLAVMLTGFFISHNSMAQLSGTKTIPGDYPTFVEAITDLNLAGVGPGGVTFDIAADYTESFADSLILTATGTSANPIVFQKQGVGANPVLTRTDGGHWGTSTASGRGDAVFLIQGGDFITWDAINLAASNSAIEYGIYMRKADTTNGCKNITIKNSTITMTKGTSAFGIGIYISNHTNGSPINNSAGIAPTDTGGRAENIFIYGNTIQNTHSGITVRGFNHSTAPRNLYNFNIVIGAAGQGNTIQNFGGGATGTSNGIYMNYSNNSSISHNTINNTTGGGTPFTGAANGILTEIAVDVDFTCSHNSLSLSSNATTSALVGIDIGFGTSAVSNTITVSHNTISNCVYTSATSGAFTGVYLSGTPINGIVRNNKVHNIQHNGTGIFSGIYTGTLAGSSWFVDSNRVSNITKSTATGATFYGIRCQTGTVQASYDTVHTVTINTTGASATAITMAGYNNVGSPTSETIFNNEIYDLSITGLNTSTSSVLNGINTNSVSTATKRIYNNTVRNLVGLTNTTIGISQALGADAQIYSNNIYNLTNNTSVTTTGRVMGISIASGTVYAYNNFISDLKAPNAASIDAIRGISSTSATTNSTVGLYNNSIYLNANTGGVNFGSSGIFHTYNATATTANLDMRNNLVVNNSTPKGTGKTVAFRRSTSTSLLNYNTGSGNNNFYAGTPGGANLIFSDGTNEDTTIDSYKTRMAPGEAASVSANSPFVNSSVAPYDLRISLVTPTQLESGGMRITTPIAVTTDYYGTTRALETGYAGTGTNPDIGAYEANMTGLDLTGPVITTEDDLAFPINTFNHTFNNVTITDGGSVNVTTFKPRVYFKRNSNANTITGNTSSDNGWKFAETTNTTSPFSFTLDFSLLHGSMAPNDTIFYFMVAQDEATTPNVSFSDAITPAVQPTSVQLSAAAFPVSGTFKHIALLDTIKGTYTVGTGGDFSSLTDSITGAFYFINRSKVIGNLVLNIISDLTENDKNILRAFNSPHTLTIKPIGGVRTLSGSSTLATRGLLTFAASRVTIDGEIGGVNSLSIVNNSVVTTNSALLFTSATDITVRNCNLSVSDPSGSSTRSGLYINGSLNNNILVENNVFKKASRGVYILGNTTTPNQQIVIRNNTFGDVDSANSIGYRAIHIGSTNNYTISENTISDMRTSSLAQRAILVDGNSTGGSITKNRISNIVYTATSTSGSQGISVSSTSDSLAVEVSNNVISGIGGYATTTPNLNSWGILILDGSYAKILNNSINFDRDRVSNTATGRMGGILLSNAASTNIDILNNMIVVTGRPNSTVGKAYAIYSIATNPFRLIGNNNYYIREADTTFNIGFYGGVNLATLANWKAAVAADSTSLNVDPSYSSANLLIPTQNSLSNAGTTAAGITTDITGVTRNATNPDIGAYEFSTNEWTGTGLWNNTSNWSRGFVPASNQTASIKSGEITTDANRTTRSLLVSSGAIANVAAGHVLTVTHGITNAGTVNVKATSASSFAQLMNNGANSGTGVYNFERVVSGSTNGWRFISSPAITTFNSFGPSPVLVGNANILTLNTASPNAWGGVTTVGTTPTAAGRGYAVYLGPLGVNNSSAAHNFSLGGSTIQSGNVTVAGLSNGDATGNFGWSLVGNPYGAHITWDTTTNTRTNIDNAYYVWDATSGGSGAYASFVAGVSNPVSVLSNYIAPMQGFLVKANAASPELTLATASRNTGMSNAQLRVSNISDIVRLRASEVNGSRWDEATFVGRSGATMAFESSFDAFKLMNFDPAAPNLFSKASGDESLSINAFEAISGSVAIPVHFVTTTDGNYAIAVDAAQIASHHVIKLEDKKTNIMHDLRLGSYSFAHLSTNSADRFVLHFNPSTVSVQDEDEMLAKAYVYDNQLFVSGMEAGEMITALRIMDMTGRIVLSETAVKAADVNGTQLNFPSGTYMIQLVTAKGMKNVKVILSK